MKKMKKSIYILAILGFVLGACDKIEEPYLEPIGGGGDNKVSINIEFMDDLTGSFDLNVFIIEDGIISPQSNDEGSIGPEPIWMDYEHNNMLRASLTSSWGINVAVDPANGTTVSKEFSFGIEDEWNLQNLSFLVFITNTDNFEIVQAAETSLTEVSATADNRVILLEEFTGHTCVNCPEATKLAHDLKQSYGEKLLLLSIHAGSLAEPSGAPYEADFRTTPGTAIFNHFAPIGVPTGMVNRTESGGSVVLFKDGWEPAIQALVDLPQQASIDISVELAQ